MNKQTHTPGDWKSEYDFTRTSKHLKIKTQDGGLIASVYLHMGQPEAEANAKLIAAAPDLLEANISALACLVSLRELLRLDKSENDFSDEVIDCIKELNAAIKKATN